MNGSTGLEGVHGSITALDLERARLGNRPDLTSDEQRGVASRDETFFFLSDPVRPVGGVEDADGVDDAWPSVLYAPTGP